MKKQKLFTTLIIIVAAAGMLVTGCTKTGSVGPAGPQGSTGAAGPTGPQGPQGPQGNANILVDTFSLVSSQWLWNDNYIFYTGSGNYNEWFTRYYKAPFKSVTAGVIDSGLVLAFMTPNLNQRTQWSPLPYTFDSGDGYSFDFVFVTSPGGVELEFYFGYQSPTATPPSLINYNLPEYSFKLVVITASMADSLQIYKVDKKSYAAVANFLGI